MAQLCFRPPSYKLWTYEEDLAMREASTLLGVRPEHSALGWTADVLDNCISAKAIQRLVFWEDVLLLDSGGDNRQVFTRQFLLENATKLARRARTLKEVPQFVLNHLNEPLNNRKESQYATHGMHRYKGKFYPQLVRALINYAGVTEGQVVLDPFVGCGTTTDECAISGMQGIGVDLNPLAAFVAKIRASALTIQAVDIADTFERWLNQIGTARDITPSANSLSLSRHGTASDMDLDYLTHWFSPPILTKLLKLRSIISDASPALANIGLILISDMLREISNQDPRDLRIRRRAPLEDAPVFNIFCQRAAEFGRVLYAFALVRDHMCLNIVPTEIHQGDSRNLSKLQSEVLRSNSVIDFVVTSPPYATALPYLDTDRLSLAFLGLLSNGERSQLEEEMIGNREISNRQRKMIEEQFLQTGKSDLPESTFDLIETIRLANNRGSAGFRKKNMPGLLFKYFLDMKQVLSECKRVLKPGAWCVLIVGNNVTYADNRSIVIDTDYQLCEIALQLGFLIQEVIPITVTTENMRHINHAIRDNSVIILKSPER